MRVALAEACGDLQPAQPLANAMSDDRLRRERSWGVTSELSNADLVQGDRFIDVAQQMIAEFGRLDVRRKPDRLGDEHLPAMSGSFDARRRIDRRTEVVIAALLRLAKM